MHTENTKSIETGDGDNKQKTSFDVGGDIDTAAYDYYEIKLNKMILYY